MELKRKGERAGVCVCVCVIGGMKFLADDEGVCVFVCVSYLVYRLSRSLFE